MRKSALRFAMIASVAVAPAAALADNFAFTYSGTSGVSAFGTLVGIANGDGSFTATSGSITVTGGTVQGTWALWLNPNGRAVSTSLLNAFYYDNQLFPTGNPVLGNAGLLFSDGIVEVNIWGNGPGSYSHWEFTAGGYAVSSDGEFTLTPAPGSLALIGMGATIAGRRRRN